MVDTLKVLGQINPAATTLTDVYTVPAATTVTISSVVICNQVTTPGTFRLSIAIAGAADTAKQYLYYNQPLDGNGTFVATIGITLAAGDVVRGYAGGTNVSFSIFGIEVT